jgi:light-regulated signal transduction histidine kinase (bacteriophytochrome)
MPSETLEIDGCRTAEAQGPSGFLADMAEGLHAMAQPLTILRSSVAASADANVSPAKRQRYLELSVRQVQRACMLFDCLQDLVVASQIPADCEPVDLAAMVAAMAGDQRAALQEAGIELRVLLPGDLPRALGDGSRTGQALSAGLKVAAMVSAAGDVIQISAATCNYLVELILRNDRVHGASLGSEERLNLRLAQTNVVSQRGEFECTEDPFMVRLALPCMPPEPGFEQHTQASV